MLECYLEENGVPSLTHVWGENPDSEETHAWIRIRDDLIIDITLDQFSKSFPPVYIGKPLAIHKEFSLLEESESNSDIDDNLELAIHYSSILRIVKSHIAPPTPC